MKYTCRNGKNLLDEASLTEQQKYVQEKIAIAKNVYENHRTRLTWTNSVKYLEERFLMRKKK